MVSRCAEAWVHWGVILQEGHICVSGAAARRARLAFKGSVSRAVCLTGKSARSDRLLTLAAAFISPDD